VIRKGNKMRAQSHVRQFEERRRFSLVGQGVSLLDLALLLTSFEVDEGPREQPRNSPPPATALDIPANPPPMIPQRKFTKRVIHYTKYYAQKTFITNKDNSLDRL